MLYCKLLIHKKSFWTSRYFRHEVLFRKRKLSCMLGHITLFSLSFTHTHRHKPSHSQFSLFPLSHSHSQSLTHPLTSTLPLSLYHSYTNTPFFTIAQTHSLSASPRNFFCMFPNNQDILFACHNPFVSPNFLQTSQFLQPLSQATTNATETRPKKLERLARGSNLSWDQNE